MLEPNQKIGFLTIVKKLALTTTLLALPWPLFAAGREGMTQMPVLKSKQVFSVHSSAAGEALIEKRGFGDNEPVVRMMNLMMVEGSGYEGMEMAAGLSKSPDSNSPHSHEMIAAASAASSSSYRYHIGFAQGNAKIGTNTITIVISDLKNGQRKTGLNPKAQVYMTSMDMGRTEPIVRETAPGEYQIKAAFSMSGPWAIQLTLPGEEKIFPVDVLKK